MKYKKQQKEQLQQQFYQQVRQQIHGSILHIMEWRVSGASSSAARQAIHQEVHEAKHGLNDTMSKEELQEALAQQKMANASLLRQVAEQTRQIKYLQDENSSLRSEKARENDMIKYKELVGSHLSLDTLARVHVRMKAKRQRSIAWDMASTQDITTLYH